jgi:hypothetical protein
MKIFKCCKKFKLKKEEIRSILSILSIETYVKNMIYLDHLTKEKIKKEFEKQNKEINEGNESSSSFFDFNRT